ncbi:hypothetical protein AGLY_002013 [Aphis glycines]|uniref:Myosin motor domain-containing protein n=1 Tax=Aphis glycines TaxID=307491 RepID=A0A6G0U4B6_APHGL|nr:hypothetical protein AGLY_002013 [Aphis glycines]
MIEGMVSKSPSLMLEFEVYANYTILLNSSCLYNYHYILNNHVPNDAPYGPTDPIICSNIFESLQCLLDNYLHLMSLWLQIIASSLFKSKCNPQSGCFITLCIVFVNFKLNLYTLYVLHEEQDIFENPAHIFAIADSVYRSKKMHRQDHCTVISGESGSSKTEASKVIMKYIAAVTNLTGQQEVERVKNILIQSNIIFETFGNA